MPLATGKSQFGMPEINVHDVLTHWGRVTHMCVSKRTIIGWDNGLSPGRRQAIIWTNAGILLIGHSGTNFSEILIEIVTFSFKKMRLKVSSAKWRPFCLGLNVLNAHYMNWCCWHTTTWWPHNMETLSPLLFLWRENPTMIGGIPNKRPAMRWFDVFIISMTNCLKKNSPNAGESRCYYANVTSLKGFDVIVIKRDVL